MEEDFYIDDVGVYDHLERDHDEEYLPEDDEPDFDDGEGTDYEVSGCDYDDSMDGDFDSGMASAEFGTDEDYGYFGDDLLDSPTDFDEPGGIDDLPDWGE